MPPRRTQPAAPSAPQPSTDIAAGPPENPKPARPPTAYESRLYALCRAIPAGKVTTYGAMAKVLTSSARAAGQALRRNPYAPEVPCHRVIAASLELGGFSGSWGPHCASVQKKRKMLKDEGVEFDGKGKITDLSAVLGPAELAKLAKLVAGRAVGGRPQDARSAC